MTVTHVPDHWYTDRDDPKTQAALRDKCGPCGAQPGEDCGIKVKGRDRRPLLTGIVHQARVPGELIGVKK